MKIRIEAEPERLLAFLAEHEYPCPWSLETLRNHCISLRVEEGFPPEPVAYVWASWKFVGVLDVHACARRRLWLTRELLDRLYTIAELFGAHSLITTPQGDRAPYMRRLLFKAGWQREGEAMQKRLELPVGYLRPTENPDPPTAAAAAATPDPHEGPDAGCG